MVLVKRAEFVLSGSAFVLSVVGVVYGLVFLASDSTLLRYIGINIFFAGTVGALAFLPLARSSGQAIHQSMH